MATIVDVANAAQVSVATVSRVLNNSYSVTEEKKKRVMDAIEKVGYEITPRMKIGRQLNNQKSVILVISSILIGNIILPFQKAADELGYRTVATYYGSDEQFEYLEQLVDSLDLCLAGILLINAADNSKKFQSLVSKYPLVQIGEPILDQGPNHVVYNDEIKMSQDATNYLLQLGRKKVAILIPEPKNLVLFSREKRLHGYYLALLSNNLPVDKSLIVRTDISVEGGYDATIRLLTQYNDIDAILGCCDVVSQGAMQALRKLNITPDQVTICSIDRNEAWDFLPIQFPFIDPHHEEMGTAAARMMHSVICDEIQGDYQVVIGHTLQHNLPFCPPSSDVAEKS